MTKPQRVKRSRADLQRELTDQLRLLRHECEQYDRGFEAIAKRLALSLRVLLHHQGQSRALLDQLGLRSGRFLDTAGPLSTANLLSEHGLVAMELRPDGARYLALVATGGIPERERMIPFVDWWNTPVLKDAKGRTFSRRELVQEVADTDGGAHVDPELTEAYTALSRQNSIGWVFEHEAKSEPFTNRPELACIRQIAHELLITLSRSNPSLAVEAAPVIPLENTGDGTLAATVQFVELRPAGEK